jgi:thioredoxin reductase
MSDTTFEVLIVGGGPAGLSAALILGRCCRKVLVCDAGTPRNWASRAMHGFITRDGISPTEFRRIALEELKKYSKFVSFWEGEVADAQREGTGFRFRTADGRSGTAQKILLATGLFDRLPPLNGVERFWGKTVHQCPYCDGWEMAGRPVAVYGKGSGGVEMARGMTAWTQSVVLVTDGPSHLTREARSQLEDSGIKVCTERIAGLEGEGDRLSGISFANGQRLSCDALFFSMPTDQQSPLAERLGCRFNPNGGVSCYKYEVTDASGVYVAGNTIKDVHLVVVAVAEGAKAALGINKALTKERFERRVAERREENRDSPAA